MIRRASFAGTAVKIDELLGVAEHPPAFDECDEF